MPFYGSGIMTPIDDSEPLDKDAEFVKTVQRTQTLLARSKQKSADFTNDLKEWEAEYNRILEERPDLGL